MVNKKQNKKMIQTAKQPAQDLRSVTLERVKTDTKGALPDDRIYHPYEGAPTANIAQLRNSLSDLYDLLLLHDPMDGCLLVDLQPNATKVITKFPCRLHQV